MADFDKPVPHAISLVLHHPPYPGWRIHIAPNEGPTDGILISTKKAEILARAVGDLIGENDADPTPFEVVRNGTEILRENVQASLDNARAAAAQVSNLEQVLEEIE